MKRCQNPRERIPNDARRGLPARAAVFLLLALAAGGGQALFAQTEGEQVDIGRHAAIVMWEGATASFLGLADANGVQYCLPRSRRPVPCSWFSEDEPLELSLDEPGGFGLYWPSQANWFWLRGLEAIEFECDDVNPESAFEPLIPQRPNLKDIRLHEIRASWENIPHEKEFTGNGVCFNFKPEIDVPGLIRFTAAGQAAKNKPAVVRLTGVRVYAAYKWQTFSGITVMEDVSVFGGNEPDWTIENGRLVSLEPVSIAGLSISSQAMRYEALCPLADQAFPARALITLRNDGKGFSFLPDEVSSNKTMWIPDFKTLVCRNGNDAQGFMAGPRPAGPQIDLVESGPEPARADIENEVIERVKAFGGGKRLWAKFVYWGLGVNRRRFGLLSNGDVALINPMQIQFGVGDKPISWLKPQGAGHCGLEDGWKPVLRITDKDGDVEYKQEAFVAFLDEKMFDVPEDRLTGDEGIALIKRVETINSSGTQPARAKLWVKAIGRDNEQTVVPVLRFQDGLLVDADGRAWCAVSSGGQGKWRRFEAGTDTFGANACKPDKGWIWGGVSAGWDLRRDEDGILICDVELGPGERSSVLFAIPNTPLPAGEAAALSRLAAGGWDAQRERMLKYRDDLTRNGMRIETPDPLVNDVYRASAGYVYDSINRRERFDEANWAFGYYNLAGWPSLTAYMTLSMDFLGFHDKAGQAFIPLLEGQGVSAPDKQYPDKGMDTSSAGCLNSHGKAGAKGFWGSGHGWVLWALAEHARYSGDAEWPDEAGSALAAGCDWIVSQRKTTMQTGPAGARMPGYGLMPEFNATDWNPYAQWVWVDAYSYRGMAAAVSVLESARHPSSPRLRAELEDYAGDIRAAIGDAMLRNAVARFNGGFFAPVLLENFLQRYGTTLGCGQPPVEAGPASRTGREGEHGSPHIFAAGILEASGREMRNSLDYWINTVNLPYLGVPGEHFAYARPQMDAFLEADMINNLLRQFYVCLIAGRNQDVHFFTEFISEYAYMALQNAFFIQALRNMLVYETADGAMLLCAGAPKSWLEHGKRIAIERAPTHYGAMSMHVNSLADQGAIEIKLEPPARCQPRVMRLRLRHPRGAPIKRVAIDGMPWQAFEPEGWVDLAGVAGAVDIKVEY